MADCVTIKTFDTHEPNFHTERVSKFREDPSPEKTSSSLLDVRRSYHINRMEVGTSSQGQDPVTSVTSETIVKEAGKWRKRLDTFIMYLMFGKIWLRSKSDMSTRPLLLCSLVFAFLHCWMGIGFFIAGVCRFISWIVIDNVDKLFLMGVYNRKQSAILFIIGVFLILVNGSLILSIMQRNMQLMFQVNTAMLLLSVSINIIGIWLYTVYFLTLADWVVQNKPWEKPTTEPPGSELESTETPEFVPTLEPILVGSTMTYSFIITFSGITTFIHCLLVFYYLMIETEQRGYRTCTRNVATDIEDCTRWYPKWILNIEKLRRLFKK